MDQCSSRAACRGRSRSPLHLRRRTRGQPPRPRVVRPEGARHVPGHRGDWRPGFDLRNAGGCGARGGRAELRLLPTRQPSSVRRCATDGAWIASAEDDTMGTASGEAGRSQTGWPERLSRGPGEGAVVPQLSLSSYVQPHRDAIVRLDVRSGRSRPSCLRVSSLSPVGCRGHAEARHSRTRQRVPVGAARVDRRRYGDPALPKPKPWQWTPEKVVLRLTAAQAGDRRRIRGHSGNPSPLNTRPRGKGVAGRFLRFTCETQWGGSKATTRRG